MKIVNSWNTENVWNGSKYVNDDYQLKVNETFDLIPQGANQPVKRVNDSWVGADKPQIIKKSVKPSEGDQAMNALGLQVAQLTIENKQLKKSINALGLQFAQAISADKKENGGN